MFWAVPNLSPDSTVTCGSNAGVKGRLHCPKTSGGGIAVGIKSQLELEEEEEELEVDVEVGDCSVISPDDDAIK